MTSVTLECKLCFVQFELKRNAKKESREMRDHRLSHHSYENKNIWRIKRK